MRERHTHTSIHKHNSQFFDYRSSVVRDIVNLSFQHHSPKTNENCVFRILAPVRHQNSPRQDFFVCFFAYKHTLQFIDDLLRRSTHTFIFLSERSFFVSFSINRLISKWFELFLAVVSGCLVEQTFIHFHSFYSSCNLF